MRPNLVRALLLASATLPLATGPLATGRLAGSATAATLAGTGTGGQRECFEEGNGTHCVDLVYNCADNDYACQIDDFTGAIIKGRGDTSIKYAAYLARGVASLKALQATDAIADFEAAQALQPRLATPFMLIAQTYLELGQHARALAAFDEADKRAPELPTILMQRAEIRGKAGDHSGAVADLTHAIAVMRAGKHLPAGSDEPVEALLTVRAEIWLAMSERNNARSDLEAALTAKPGYAPAMAALAKLAAK